MSLYSLCFNYLKDHPRICTQGLPKIHRMAINEARLPKPRRLEDDLYKTFPCFEGKAKWRRDGSCIVQHRDYTLSYKKIYGLIRQGREIVGFSLTKKVRINLKPSVRRLSGLIDLMVRPWLTIHRLLDYMPFSYNPTREIWLEAINQLVNSRRSTKELPLPIRAHINRRRLPPPWPVQLLNTFNIKGDSWRLNGQQIVVRGSNLKRGGWLISGRYILETRMHQREIGFNLTFSGHQIAQRREHILICIPNLFPAQYRRLQALLDIALQPVPTLLIKNLY